MGQRPKDQQPHPSLWSALWLLHLHFQFSGLSHEATCHLCFSRPAIAHLVVSNVYQLESSRLQHCRAYVFACLIPLLVCRHFLTVELVWDHINCDFNVLDLGGCRKPHCFWQMSQQQDPENCIKIPFMLSAGTLRLMFLRVSVRSWLFSGGAGPCHTGWQDSQYTGFLHMSQICWCDHVILQRNVVNHIAGHIVWCLDHPGALIEGQLIFQSVSKHWL